jgi:peptide/nickel transport system substrate-binding protein/glutathione transport system substrate-binding protein
MDNPPMGGVGRRAVLAGGVAAASLAVLPRSLRAAPRRGGTLHIAMPYNPAALDPATGRNTPDFNTLYTLYDALIDFDPDTLELKPALAKAWRFTDPKTLVLDLIDGVEFHDGTPFNAEAAKFNLDRYKTNPRSNAKSDLNAVATVEVTGKSQITIHLSKPNSGLPTILTNRVGLMVSPTSIQKHGPNVDRMPVGTGPFKFAGWQDNYRISVTRNPNYWRAGLPHLDGIEFHIINELNTAGRTVSAGETQLALDMTVQQKLAADKLGGLITTATTSLIFFGAHINFAQPPLTDQRIRQALNYGVDREELNKVLVAGLGEPSSHIMPKDFWATDPSTIHYYHYDPDRAKKLLADAGHAGGIELAAWGWPDQASMQRQELIESQLAKAGIRLKLTPRDPVQVASEFYIKKHGGVYIAPSGGYPDPSQFYDALYGKNAFLNSAAIDQPGYRPLLDATMSAQSRDERKAAFAKLQLFCIEQALEIPQFIAPAVSIMSPKLKNFTAGILNCPKLTEVWLEA